MQTLITGDAGFISSAAFHNGWLDGGELVRIGKEMDKSEYGQHLLDTPQNEGDRSN